MERRWKEPRSDQTATRLKRPVNPSVLGAGKQSGRAAKGVKRAATHGEGSGYPADHGQGGKVRD